MIRLEMKNYNTILREKQQKFWHYYQINWLNLTLLNWQIWVSYRYEEILPSDQSRVIEQAKFAYSSLGKVFEKQIRNN